MLLMDELMGMAEAVAMDPKARAPARYVMRQALGRVPTDAEVRDLVGRANRIV